MADDVERTVRSDGTATDGAGTDAATTSIRVGDAVHLDVAGRSVAFRLAPAPDVDRISWSATLPSHARRNPPYP